MISVKNLSFSIGDFRLSELDLEVAGGEYFVLLGPPGSGKTVFLECLCGLKRVGSGRIYLGGRDVTFVEPRARPIGYVPQDYALFPHLSVEQNIGFSLKESGYRSCDILEKVNEIARMLGIEGLLGRDVAGLSGGEKQRTALARALVREPKVLLLDEPVCALDESMRQNVCDMLHRIQRRLNLTTVHVSHNVEEAFSVADRAAIFNEGSLQQVGSLDDLLRKPNSEFVARFMRCENIFCGEAARQDAGGSKTVIKVNGIEIAVPGVHSEKVKFIIRPEDVLVLPGSEAESDNENSFTVRVVRWRSYGSYVRVEFDGCLNVVAHLTTAVFARLKCSDNKEFKVRLGLEGIHVLEK